MPTFSKPPAVPLEGALVTLRQLSEVWLDEVEAMVNDPIISQATATTKRFSTDELEAWLTSRRHQIDRCDWAIIDSDSEEFAGEIVLNEYAEKTNSMNLRIALAGERWFGQGFGTDAMVTVLTYAFDKLELSKVTLEVLVSNERAQLAYQKVGFSAGRQFNEGKFRFQRMAITKLEFVAALARLEMAKHLDVDVWAFSFDSAKRRAGLCDHTNRRISLSRYLSELHPIDQSHQVMLHEIGHAMVGAKHGHDKKWLTTAKGIGYRNEKISAREVDEEKARWAGLCPNGHEYFRYKQPKRISSCSKCNKAYDDRYRITWSARW
ncbi:MAG: hypothetical protein RIR34_458 [Actinomycetota bacterium]